MFAVTVISQGAGFIVLFAALPLVPGRFSMYALAYGAAAGLCAAAGIALLYHALSIGKMGVVSPITAVLAAALPLAVGVALGERLRAAQIAGIVIALLAVVLISMTPEGRGNESAGVPKGAGVREALASGVILGGFYILLARSGNGAGLYPLIGARAASTGALLLAALALRKSLVPTNGTLPMLFVIGVLDMAANCLYLTATYAGYLSIAAVLTSLYPASTVLLARFVINERLSAVQKLGVALALTGVVLISL